MFRVGKVGRKNEKRKGNGKNWNGEMNWTTGYGFIGAEK